jgi:hypothetical protein
MLGLLVGSGCQTVGSALPRVRDKILRLIGDTTAKNGGAVLEGVTRRDETARASVRRLASGGGGWDGRKREVEE